MTDQNRNPNRLSKERSPYLLQHAYNPVDWYSWGEEAFAKARLEEKPIFLSIGYSTCHWCHVMERESFEDDGVARYLNEHFVSIKLDREERPDIDAIYMAATQAMTGSGGWPMTVILTPELQPFFCGTYFPPKPAYGKPSFMALLERIIELWNTKRDELIRSGNGLVDAILKASEEDSATKFLSPTLGDSAIAFFERTFDSEHGGFGKAPKFPRPVQFDFLFNHYFSTGDERAKEMALFTLRQMADGGLNDHLGGGFHRYSVDSKWLVSHFEKMLYDQAQLVHSYLDAYQITHNQYYVEVVRSICDFVIRELTHPQGGFYCALDADSEGEEGTFYVWQYEEIENTLGEKDAQVVAAYFGITKHGNWEHGKNVLYRAISFVEVGDALNIDRESAEAIIHAAQNKLFELRARRIRPHLDDKILASWNGLMIGAMARAGDVLDSVEYTSAARAAAEFVWQKLYQEPGDKLLHRWRDGDARFDATLDTYAFLVKGYVELYQSTMDSCWLDRAIILQQEQDDYLYDSSKGGYFTSRQASDVILRTKNDYDGAEPSGNSISVLNLLALYAATSEARYKEQAERTLLFFAGKLSKYPYTMPEMLVGIEWHHSAPTQIVFAGKCEGGAYQEIRREIAKFYLPRKVVISGQSKSASEFIRTLPTKESEPTVYFCALGQCELPVYDSGDVGKFLEKTRWRSE